MLRGVQVCGIGPAKGHGVLVDQETLNRLNALAGKQASGIRLKFNPSTFSHGEASVIGLLEKTSFAMGSDGVLRADAKIAKSAPGFAFLFDLADMQPENIALSVEFDGEPEDIGGVLYARPTEFMAAAIVDMGAATSGLFSVADPDAAPAKAKEKKTEPATETATNDPTNMAAFTPEQMEALKGLFKDALAPIITQVSALSAAKDEEKKPDTTGMSAEEIAAENLAAGVKEGDDEKTAYRKVNKYRAAADKPVTMRDLTGMFSKVGGVPAAGGAQDMKRKEQGGACEFSTKVQALMDAGGITRQSAMAAVQKSHPALHRAYIAKQMSEAGQVKVKNAA